MLVLYHPMSSPMMTRMLGFLGCAFAVVRPMARNIARNVNRLKSRFGGNLRLQDIRPPKTFVVELLGPGVLRTLLSRRVDAQSGLVLRKRTTAFLEQPQVIWILCL